MTFPVREQRMPGTDRPAPTSRNLALKRLGRREYSGGELIAYLLRKGFPESEAQATVGELSREGLVDDLRYARMMVRHQALRGKGPRYILTHLRAKGVRMEVKEIETILEEIGVPSGVEAAQAIVERRYPEAQTDRRTAERAYQALMRRGFSHDVAAQVVFSKKRGNA